SGKSALANVLVNTANELKEVFKESSSTVSVTQDVQFAEFETEDSKYQVIDVPDSFDREEIKKYNLLKQKIFGEDITKYVTIIRTKFAEFDQDQDKEDDIEEMIKNGGEQCSSVKRSKSRKILLSHLENNCQGVYQPQNLKKVTAKIKESLIKKKELEQKLVNLKKTEKQQVKELKSEIQKESKNIRQYLKEISWNNVATTTQTVAGVASVVISIVPLCRIM
ncbi:8966_t:CDS:2, partial [Entrophospora sp. SA101]